MAKGDTASEKDNIDQRTKAIVTGKVRGCKIESSFPRGRTHILDTTL